MVFLAELKEGVFLGVLREGGVVCLSVLTLDPDPGVSLCSLCHLEAFSWCHLWPVWEVAVEDVLARLCLG